MQDPSPPTVTVPARASATLAEVRAWARKRGAVVGTRGHLPESLIRQYNRSHHRHAVSGNPKVRET